MSVLANAILAQYESILRDLQSGLTADQAAQSGAVFSAGVTMLLFAVILVSAARGSVPYWSAPCALPFAAVFGRKYLRARHHAWQMSRLSRFYERGVARLTGDWAASGDNGEDFRRRDHMFEQDLNILGDGSLFQLLCTARTQLGRAKLADYLLEPASVEEIASRQEAVRELAPKAQLRESVHLLGRYDFEGAEWRAFEEWLSMPAVRSSRAIRAFMAVNSIAVAAMLLAIFAGAAPVAPTGQFVAVLAAVQAAVGMRWRRATKPVLERVRRFGGDVALLREGLQLLKGQRFTSQRLQELVADVDGQGANSVQRLEHLVSRLYDCDKDWFYGPSRLLFVPVQLALAIEEWKARYGRELRIWAAAWGEFEALNSLGCYSYEHPQDVFPTVCDDAPVMRAKALGHPLLRDQDCVRNDVELGPERTFYLVSGSNMAGKSTFLRAIGTNAVLASAGAPVRATEATVSAFAICTSIATADSLLEGKSRFLAEVSRIRGTVDALAGPRRVLFLFDEIFSGTNSTDRRSAAEAVVRRLTIGGAVGALSTHDLALTRIADDRGLRGVNIHFASDGSGDPLSFDYKAKPGICTESNAAAILRMSGVTEI